MTILSMLQLLALGFMIAGLVAVILEIAVKDPSAFGEIAADTARFAVAVSESRDEALGNASAGTAHPRRAADAVPVATHHRRAA